MTQTLILLTLSNIFMTFAWYGHLKFMAGKPLFYTIVISWIIAFFEYCLQVPGNRHGFGSLTLSQLKVIQEVITMIVFAIFSYTYMKIPVTRNFYLASVCLFMAVFFIFKDVKTLHN